MSGWDVRVQVAWIILLIESEAIEGRKAVPLDVLLDAIDGTLAPAAEKSFFNLKMLQRTRKVLRHYMDSGRIWKSTMSSPSLCDSIAIVFSHLAASVCCAQSGVAHCLGEPFFTETSAEHFVAVGFRTVPWKGLVAVLHMPLSDWAKTQIVPKLPLENDCLSSDSTLQDMS